MSESQACPICGNPMPLDAIGCPICHYKPSPGTQKFTPASQTTRAFTPVSTNKAAAQGASGRVCDPALRVVKGPQTEALFYLDRPEIVLGRDPLCDIFLNDMTVSRIHATISITPGCVTLTDKDSLNGTWVDGKVCDRAELHDGSIIQIGTFVMIFEEHPALH